MVDAADIYGDVEELIDDGETLPSRPNKFFDELFEKNPDLRTLIFVTPPEGLETELMLYPERLPLPYFLRLHPCFVRVYYGDEREMPPASVPLREGVWMPYVPGLAHGF